jgi:hypothetical protein
MGGVDLADQYRASYAEKRRTCRTWIPLFKFLLQSTIANAVKIWIAQGHSTIKDSASHKFRKQLAVVTPSGHLTSVHVSTPICT